MSQLMHGEMEARAIARANARAMGITDEKKQDAWVEWVQTHWWVRWLSISSMSQSKSSNSFDSNELLRAMAEHYWSEGEERSRSASLTALARKLGIMSQFARALDATYPADFITRKTEVRRKRSA